MKKPLGFVAQGEIGKVFRLQKSLYGLKQSPLVWFGKFSQTVEEFGMQKSKSDHSVFYRNSSSGIILLVVYIDNIIITGSDFKGISSLKSFLQSQFHTKDLGMLRYFLGVEVMRSKHEISKEICVGSKVLKGESVRRDVFVFVRRGVSLEALRRKLF